MYDSINASRHKNIRWAEHDTHFLYRHHEADPERARVWGEEGGVWGEEGGVGVRKEGYGVGRGIRRKGRGGKGCKEKG